MVEECTDGVMAPAMKESGRMILCKEKELISGLMEDPIMATGSTERCTEKVNINGPKAEFTKVILRMTRDKDKAPILCHQV